MNLFVQGRLNYFEALHRMAYWIEKMEKHDDPGGRILGKISILQRALVKYALSNDLWIDPFYTKS